MSHFEMRRRSFLKLLGLAGAAATITPLQEELLSLPATEPVGNALIPVQGDIWLRGPHWFRVGTMVTMELTLPPPMPIPTIANGDLGWLPQFLADDDVTVSLTADGSFANLCDLQTAFASDPICDASIFIADRHFHIPRAVFSRLDEADVMTEENVTIGLSLLARDFPMLPWQPGDTIL